jgi:hypothetical protein
MVMPSSSAQSGERYPITAAAPARGYTRDHRRAAPTASHPRRPSRLASSPSPLVTSRECSMAKKARKKKARKKSGANHGKRPNS